MHTHTHTPHTPPPPPNYIQTEYNGFVAKEIRLGSRIIDADRLLLSSDIPVNRAINGNACMMPTVNNPTNNEEARA